MLYGKTLSGEKTSTFDLLKGNISLVSVCMYRFGEDQAEKYLAPFNKSFEGPKDPQVVQINLQERLIHKWIVSLCSSLVRIGMEEEVKVSCI